MGGNRVKVMMRVAAPDERRIPRRVAGRRGFTLIELFTVILVIGILMGLLLPVVARVKERARAVQCIGNLRQTLLGFDMFSEDNQFFPSNNFIEVVDFFTIPNGTWAPLAVAGDRSGATFIGGCLAPYLGMSKPEVFRCPSDRRRAGAGKPASGLVPSLQSYNLSTWINCEAVPLGYHREEELQHAGLGPSEIMGFIDVNEESIVDPAFGIFQQDDAFYRNLWVDLPSDRHARAANIQFFDGHVAAQRWKAPKIFEKNGQRAKAGDDLSDLRRLQGHVPRPNPL